MADETKNATETTTASEVDYKTQYEELQASYAKLKSANDKTSSENAEYKRKERERMTEDERRKTEIEESNAKYEAMAKELSVFKYTAKLSATIKDEKAATKIATLFAEGNFEKAIDEQNAYFEKYAKDLETKIKAELMQTNPQATAQSGSKTVTKADILAIKDPIARQEAIAKNLHLFS